MATFSVALLIILIGFGFSALSVRADEQQNQTENGGRLKHLFGLDGIDENKNAMNEKMSGIEAKLEQIEKIFTKLCDNQNGLGQKVLEIGTKFENQIENVFTEAIKICCHPNWKKKFKTIKRHC